MTTEYLFTSARLGFRQWIETDIPLMAAINADREVMEYFPATQDQQQTAAFISRMQQQMADKGYCYYAVDVLADGAFIGFIGLSDKTFEASFTPCVDIGWRLGRSAWYNGYATEGAKRCLKYGLNELQLGFICSMAPKVNKRSEHIMQKIGMQKLGEFTHPLLADDERLRECVVYKTID